MLPAGSGPPVLAATLPRNLSTRWSSPSMLRSVGGPALFRPDRLPSRALILGSKGLRFLSYPVPDESLLAIVLFQEFVYGRLAGVDLRLRLRRGRRPDTAVNGVLAESIGPVRILVVLGRRVGLQRVVELAPVAPQTFQAQFHPRRLVEPDASPARGWVLGDDPPRLRGWVCPQRDELRIRQRLHRSPAAGAPCRS